MAVISFATACAETPVAPPTPDAGTSTDGGTKPDSGSGGPDGGLPPDTGPVAEVATWIQVDAPNQNLAYTRIIGSGPNDIYLLGQSASASPGRLLGHGIRCHLRDRAHGTTTDHGGLNLSGTFSVSGTARDDVYVGGLIGMGYFDGERLTRVNGGSEVLADREREIWSLTFNDTTDVLSVVLTEGPQTTVWSLESDEPGGRIHASGDDVWLAAAPGVVHQRANGVFVEHRIPPAVARLRQVFIAAPDDVWFAGEDGTIVRFALPSDVPEPSTTIEVVSAEVPPPIEPEGGVGRLRLVNASGAAVRFCSTAIGSLMTRPIAADETVVGFFDVQLGLQPEVRSFRVGIEPASVPECQNGG